MPITSDITLRNLDGVRASSLPLAFRCPGSLHGEGLSVDAIGEAAGTGAAVHEVLADIVRQGLDDVPELADYAGRHGVADIDQLGMLARFGLKAWRELREQYFLNPMVEVYLDDRDPNYPQSAPRPYGPRATANPEINGHLDVYSPMGDRAALLDWKSGRLDMDHYHQMAAYAWLALEDGNPETVTAAVVLLREQAYRVFKFTRRTLVDWHGRFLKEVAVWDGRFHVGEHCRFCPRQGSCPARQAMVRATVAELLGPTLPAVDAANRAAMGPVVVDLYRRVKVVKSAIDRFDDWLRTEIEANGPIPTGEGSQLALVPQSREKIEALAAWPIIAKHLSDIELAPAVTIGKTALLEAVAAKAPPRGKGRAKAALMEELRAAGAVKTTEITTLREVRGGEIIDLPKKE